MSLTEIGPWSDDSTWNPHKALEFVANGIDGLRATVTATGATLNVDSKDGDQLDADFGPSGLALEFRREPGTDDRLDSVASEVRRYNGLTRPEWRAKTTPGTGASMAADLYQSPRSQRVGRGQHRW